MEAWSAEQRVGFPEEGDVVGDPWEAVSEDVGHHDWHAPFHHASEKAEKSKNLLYTNTYESWNCYYFKKRKTNKKGQNC